MTPRWPRIEAALGQIWLAQLSLFWVILPAAAQNAAPPAAVPAEIPVESTTAGPQGAATVQVAQLQGVVVNARRLGLLGKAATASEGVVADEELQLTPIYRPGQLLETVPGLVVTIHSGEAKANQYLMRGYNLDHGTDLATFIDGMPVNQPTHAHGQGYTDLNFLIPELADEITYTKGPYHPAVGDFGAVGSVRIAYRDTIPDQVTATLGTLGYERLFAAGSRPLAGGNLLAAGELLHYDGPFVTPDDIRKENLVLRYSRGDERQGWSLTASYYHSLATNTTDIPDRAITTGLVPNRFGSLDPTDGVRPQRANLGAQYRTPLGAGELAASAYVFDNNLELFNNFTHFLVDPMHGDQEDQHEFRTTGGGQADYTLPLKLLSFDSVFAAGMVTRYDALRVGRTPSEARRPLPPADDPPAFSNLDQVNLWSAGGYLQLQTRWTPWLRSVLGLREDYQNGGDTDYLTKLHLSGPTPYANSGNASRALFQPKGSLIFRPGADAEFYLSAGRGFHSADLRGVNQSRVAALQLPASPLLASQVGEEIGVRYNPRRDLALAAAVYNLDQESETIINPDIGQDLNGPPSRRYGFELNLTYKIRRWLEVYASYSGDHARFKSNYDDGTGHLGKFITNAPVGMGSLDLYLKNLGRWSGGLEYRYLGGYALASGPCADAAAMHDFPATHPDCAAAVAAGLTRADRVKGTGYGEVNVSGRYDLGGGWNAGLGIYNLFDIKASAAQFYYVDRLKSEIATFADGRADVHEHPLEPIAARFTLNWVFGD